MISSTSAHRLIARRAFDGHDRDLRAAAAAEAPACALVPNMHLVRRLRNDDEVVLPAETAATAACRGRRRPCIRSRRRAPSCRSDRCPTARTAPGTALCRARRRAAGATLRASVKNRPNDSLTKLTVAKFSVAPSTATGRCAFAAVEHALCGLAAQPWPSQMSTTSGRRRQLLDRRRVVDGEIGPAHQLGEVLAGGEAHDAPNLLTKMVFGPSSRMLSRSDRRSRGSATSCRRSR